MLSPRICLCWILLCVAACGSGAPQPAAPTAPAPVAGIVSAPPPIPQGVFAIRGTVSERLPGGGLRPMSGVSVNAWVSFDRMGYSYWYANGPRYSQGNGEYVLTNLPQGARVQLEMSMDGYVQQCAAPPMVMTSDATIDTQLVSRKNLSVSLDWVTVTPGLRYITGVVYEMTPTGRLPAAGAWVDYEAAMDTAAAATYTDSEGRYMLCGIPEDEPADIVAWLDPRRNAYVKAPPHVTSIDLVVP